MFDITFTNFEGTHCSVCYSLDSVRNCLTTLAIEDRYFSDYFDDMLDDNEVTILGTVFTYREILQNTSLYEQKYTEYVEDIIEEFMWHIETLNEDEGIKMYDIEIWRDRA